ncbi:MULTISPECIES: DUF6046 domain-containing protein [unclassified Sphingobacterium]|uniref:DUF6046 domain-containing protein n=1 Tax=unclassified Sphingobacterium TaxID=2609468 RepID=UPI0025DDDC32|nr:MULTISPECIES: DUF6046 domain-containing protein [unclassified Sphingobacterium]
MAIINISDIYQKAFNIMPRYLIPNYSDVDILPPEYSGIQVWQEEEYAELSELGTPILEKIILRPGSYTDFEIVEGLPKKRTINFDGYTFPIWPMVDVSQNKVIVKTAINGRPNTVKEYIYTDDHQVTIRGIITGIGNEYPHQEKRQMYNMFAVNSSYEVEARGLNDIGVQSLVIENIDFGDIEGYNNVCTFTISAVSDIGVLLSIKEIAKS